MKIEKTNYFIKEYKKLPPKVKSLYKKQEEIFISNWSNILLFASYNYSLILIL